MKTLQQIANDIELLAFELEARGGPGTAAFDARWHLDQAKDCISNEYDEDADSEAAARSDMRHDRAVDDEMTEAA